VTRMYLEEGRTAKQIAKHYGVDESKIDNLVHRLGLKKGTNSGEFKEGFTPWNKGKEGVNGVSATRFKAGHNKVQDGEIRVQKGKEGLRKYIYVDGKRRLYHRHVYMERNPEFKGVIKFLDGNALNCDLANLKGITRGENMLANSVEAGTPRKKSIAMRAGMNRKARAEWAKQKAKGGGLNRLTRKIFSKRLDKLKKLRIFVLLSKFKSTGYVHHEERNQGLRPIPRQGRRKIAFHA
jgi:hypothetical protein